MSKPSLQQNMTRREKIAKTGSTVFVAVAIASVLTAFSVVSLKFLWSKKSYNDRVIAAKTKARDAIQNNITSIDKLTTDFPTLEGNPAANSKIILHSLPPNYDYAALATSVDSVAKLSGVQYSGSIGEDLSANALKSSETSSPQEIPVSIAVDGNYDSIVKFIKNLELSIRPFHIATVDYTGTNGQLKATLTAVTYYQPSRSLDVSESEIK